MAGRLVPPEAGAVTRSAAAVEVALAYPAPTGREDLVEVPTALADIPVNALVCPVDSYVQVFLPQDRLARLNEAVAAIGRVRDLE